eukprot:SAG25_NODE_3530_length_1051_cov_1.449580_2_plen_207_part_01
MQLRRQQQQAERCALLLRRSPHCPAPPLRRLAAMPRPAPLTAVQLAYLCAALPARSAVALAPPATCTTALLTLCGDERHDPVKCGVCAGTNALKLRQAGCDNSVIEEWCRAPAPPALNDTTIQAAVESCLGDAPMDGNCSRSTFGPMPRWDVSKVTNMDARASAFRLTFVPQPSTCLRAPWVVVVGVSPTVGQAGPPAAADARARGG